MTRLETVRVSRAAADQRRGRAGRTEPGVCYRLWDEPQTAALEPYRPAGNPRRRPFLLRARPRGLGQRPGATRLPRSAAAAGADRGESAARRARRHRRRRPHHRRGPAFAATAAAAAACPHGGRRRARKARRLRPRRSPRSSASAGSAATTSICASGSMRCTATVRAAAAMPAPWPQRWAEIANRIHAPALPTRENGNKRRRAHRPRLPRAHRKKSRRRRGWRIFAGERPRRDHRCRLAAGARTVSRRGRTCRQRRGWPHPALPRRSHLPRSKRALPTASKRARRSLSTPASGSLRGRKSRRLGAIALSDQQMRVEPTRSHGKAARRKHRARRHRSAAMEQSAHAMARSRHVPARQRRRRVAGFVRRGACRTVDEWLAPILVVQDRH